jgi:hypothetical protein
MSLSEANLGWVALRSFQVSGCAKISPPRVGPRPCSKEVCITINIIPNSVLVLILPRCSNISTCRPPLPCYTVVEIVRQFNIYVVIGITSTCASSWFSERPGGRCVMISGGSRTREGHELCVFLARPRLPSARTITCVSTIHH